jgi:hypothetical protein
MQMIDIKNVFIEMCENQTSLVLSREEVKYTLSSESEEEILKWYKALKKWCVQKNRHHYFHEEEMIGKGSFGKVNQIKIILKGL